MGACLTLSEFFSPSSVGVLNALVVVMEEHQASAPRDASSVVAGAILSAVSARPLISQRYKVRVGAAKAVCKKISYTNTYMERRIFRFRTNCPQVFTVVFARHIALHSALPCLADRLDSKQILAFRGAGLRKDGSWDLELAAGDAGFVSMRIRAPEISETSVQARAEIEALIFITSIEVVVGGRSSGGEEPEENEECLSIVAKAVPADQDDAAGSSPSKASLPGNAGTPTISPEKAVSGGDFRSRQGGRGAAV